MDTGNAEGIGLLNRIALCFPLENSQCQQIREAAEGWEVINAGQEGIADAILEVDIFCGHAKVPIPWPEVVRQGRLQWIQSSAAGLDHCLTPEVVQSPIRVTSASGLFVNQVAEQTMALLLGILRRVPVFLKAAQTKEFIRRPTDDLHGKTIGIVGFGGNGRRIAEILAPFGNRILATDRFPTQCPPHVDQLLPADRLHELLQNSDVVILCIPLLESTRHLIDEKALSVMRSNTILINVARGQVVDEKALIQSLQNGDLAAAGLDVTYEEPLPPDNPLWEMANVLISPHVGAQSARRVPDTVEFFCKNLARFRNGLSLHNEVDKELGFPRPPEVECQPDTPR